MNNEPVAWMYETELQDGTTVKRVTGAWELKYKYIVDGCDKGYPIPLYTHPVKEQLTEIELEATFNRGYKEGAMDYASKCNPVKDLADEEIHQAIRRGFSRDGFLSDGIFLEIKEVLRKAQEK